MSTVQVIEWPYVILPHKRSASIVCYTENGTFAVHWIQSFLVTKALWLQEHICGTVYHVVWC